MEIPRITGLPQAIPNSVTKDIRFILTIENSEPVGFVANYAVATQIASTLGAALDMLRAEFTAQGAAVPVKATEIREMRIHKALLGDSVVLELITMLGIPYIFQFPAHMAVAAAERLRNEAAKDHPAGRA